MKLLWPFIRQMRAHLGWVLLGSLLGLVTLLASIGLLALSGWFVSATALAGVTLAGAKSFNYFTPGAGVRGFAILRTAGRYAERITTHEATFRLIAHLRSWFYRHVEPLGPSRLRKYGSAELLNRLVGDVAALDNLYLRILSPTLIALCVVALVAAFLAYFNGQLAVIAVAGLLLAGFVLPWIGYRLGADVGAQQVRYLGGLRQNLITLVQGMADLRIYGGMGKALDSAGQSEAMLLQTQRRMGVVTALVGALMTLVSGATVVAVLVQALQLVSHNLLQPVQLALVLFCVLAAFEAVAPLPVAYQYLGKTREAARRLVNVTSAEADIRYGELDDAPPSPGALRFEGVNFSYGGEQPALVQLDFAINPGEKVVLVGHSGSGKSSVLNLLARFWDPDGGTITLSGRPIADFTEDRLRAQMSVLSQPVGLFAGTVRDNLRVGSTSASDAEMQSLLEQLDLWEALTEQGLEYQIGEGGGRLSGGQRKRLALARALLRPAPLLLLDEPTEGLDSVTELRSIETLLSYHDEQTVVMITHHLAALERFDRVIVLDSGRVLEQGSPAQLLTQPDSRLNQLRELI